MKKSVLAIAVGAALAMAAAAQAEVSISGRGHVSIDSIDNGDESFIYVSSNSSRIAFKATEEIEGGLKAGFSVEQQIVMDGTGTTVFDRETFVSLGGGFGTAMVGKIDSPIKVLGRKIDFFGDQVGDSRNLTSQSSSFATVLGSTANCTAAGFTAAQCSAKPVGFDARPNNLISYTTPDMGGVGVTVAFIPEDGVKDGSGFDVAVNYTGGPLFAGFAYTTHGEGANVGGETESGFRLGAAYTMGDMKFAGMYQSATNVGGGEDFNNSVIGGGASFKVGAGSVKAQIYLADDIEDADDTGATLFAIGYDHNLSKNTMVYAAYAMTSNADFAAYSVAGAGHGANPGVFAVGESPSAISFGMNTKF